MATSSITYADRVRVGDLVLVDGRYVRIDRVKKAQGRKPAEGENLHLIAGDELLRFNSLDTVRIRPQGR